MPTVIYSPRLANSSAAPAANNIPTSGPLRQALPTDSFGVAPMNPTAIAQGLGQVAQGLGQLDQRIGEFQQRVATTQAEEALVNFEREKNNFFFNPENGYFNSQGRNAYEQAEPAVTGLVELRQKYMDQLESPEARDMFGNASNAQLTRAQQDVMRHASVQFNAWETATLKSRLENTIENAGVYWNDPSQRSVQLELGRQTIMDLAMTQGLGPETIAENLQTYNSQFATATIDSALNVSAAAGQQALAENKEMLEAPDMMKVQIKIDTRLKAEMEQLNSNAAINISTNLVSQFGDLPSARTIITDQINQIENPELRSKALRESNYQLDNRLRAKSESQAAVFETAEKFLTTGGTVDQFIAANPQGWQEMTAAQQRKLKSGEVITTDFRTLSSLINLPRSELARVNPADYVDKLSDTDRRYLEGQVRDAITGAPEGQVGRTRAAEVTSTITQLFGDDKSWNNEERGKVDAFYSMITAEEQYREQLKGAPLSAQEFSGILNDMSRKAVIEKKWWPDAEMSLPEVPAQELTPISAILRGNGYPVTSDNIIRIYRQRQQMRDNGSMPPVGQDAASTRVYTNASGPLRSGFRPSTSE